MLIDIITAIRRMAVQVVHAVVKSATKGFFAHAETVRIFCNCCKVFSHLSATLQYCLIYPRAMDDLRAIASVFAVDLFAETRAPCLVANWDYYWKLKTAMLAPVVIFFVLFLVGIFLATSDKNKRENASEVKATRSMLRRQHMEQKRGTDRSILIAAWWRTAAWILFSIDLIYPLVTRTLLQFFTCHDLGSAGRWLEVSYEIRCDKISSTYNDYYTVTGVVGALWALGIPALFYFLVHRFQRRGRDGDKVVQAAIGWMCKFISSCYVTAYLFLVI